MRSFLFKIGMAFSDNHGRGDDPMGCAMPCGKSFSNNHKPDVCGSDSGSDALDVACGSGVCGHMNVSQLLRQQHYQQM